MFKLLIDSTPVKKILGRRYGKPFSESRNHYGSTATGRRKVVEAKEIEEGGRKIGSLRKLKKLYYLLI